MLMEKKKCAEYLGVDPGVAEPHARDTRTRRKAGRTCAETGNPALRVARVQQFPFSLSTLVPPSFPWRVCTSLRTENQNVEKYVRREAEVKPPPAPPAEIERLADKAEKGRTRH